LRFRNAVRQTDRGRPLKRAGCRRFDHIKVRARLWPHCRHIGMRADIQGLDIFSTADRFLEPEDRI